MKIRIQDPVKNNQAVYSIIFCLIQGDFLLAWEITIKLALGEYFSSSKTTLPETDKSHLKMDGWNTTLLLGRPIFRCYVSFREGKFSNYHGSVEHGLVWRPATHLLRPVSPLPGFWEEK